MAHEHCCGGTFWVYILIICGLVLFAGLMSGLTLGLMSLGLVDLEVLLKSGTPEDRKHAAKILPVVKNQHLLLCTLLICNALAMEALPIFLDSLVEAWGAVLISVTLILLFGEIIPQAVCSRYGLAVGAAMAPVVRVIMWVVFPVSYPISKLLDKFLGKGHVALFRRAELKTLVNMHGNEAGKGGELTHDETTIIAGALELSAKTAAQAMTLISSAFAIDINAKLDLETMNLIMSRGHSRLPVYAGKPTQIIGLILVKNLLTIQPQDETPVRNITIRKIPRVPEDMPLYDILNEFQKGHSHMAAVVKKHNKDKPDVLVKSVTKPDANSHKGKNVAGDAGPHNIIGVHLPEDYSRERSPEERSPTRGNSKGTLYSISVNLSASASGTPNGLSNNGMSPRSFYSALKKDGEGMGDDVHANSQKDKRWAQVKSGNVLELDTEAVPSFPSDEEVVGIITMEDVIEELLQEEILDETDEYIDVHERIKVNLKPAGENLGPSSLPPSRLSSLKRPTSPLLGRYQLATPPSPASSDLCSTPFASTPPRFSQPPEPSSAKTRFTTTLAANGSRIGFLP